MFSRYRDRWCVSLRRRRSVRGMPSLSPEFPEFHKKSSALLLGKSEALLLVPLATLAYFQPDPTSNASYFPDRNQFPAARRQRLMIGRHLCRIHTDRQEYVRRYHRRGRTGIEGKTDQPAAFGAAEPGVDDEQISFSNEGILTHGRRQRSLGARSYPSRGRKLNHER